MHGVVPPLHGEQQQKGRGVQACHRVPIANVRNGTPAPICDLMPRSPSSGFVPKKWWSCLALKAFPWEVKGPPGWCLTINQGVLTSRHCVGTEMLPVHMFHPPAPPVVRRRFTWFQQEMKCICRCRRCFYSRDTAVPSHLASPKFIQLKPPQHRWIYLWDGRKDHA